MARICLVLMIWSIAPWQWFCHGHNHFSHTGNPEIQHEESSLTFHGCQQDFFAPFHETYSVNVYNPFSVSVIQCLKIGETPYLTLGLALDRAPPTIPLV